MINKFIQSLLILSLIIINQVISSSSPIHPRKVVDLDGEWQVAQGSLDEIPESFDHVVPVPGLMDMAKPAFKDVGLISDLRGAFWYRKTFVLEQPVSDVAILKIHKAKYGIQLYVNGQFVAEHWPCFTPGYFDIRKYLMLGLLTVSSRPSPLYP